VGKLAGELTELTRRTAANILRQTRPEVFAQFKANPVALHHRGGAYHHRAKSLDGDRTPHLMT